MAICIPLGEGIKSLRSIRGVPMYQLMALSYRLSSFPLSEYGSVSIHSPAEEHLDASFRPLWIKLLWMCLRSFCGYLFALPWDKGAELPGQGVGIFELNEKSPNCFPRWLCHSIFSPVVSERSSCSRPHQRLLWSAFHCSRLLPLFTELSFQYWVGRVLYIP